MHSLISIALVLAAEPSVLRTYQRAVDYREAGLTTRDGPARYALEALWQYDGESRWKPVSVERRARQLDGRASVSLSDVAGRPLQSALYWAIAEVDGHRECALAFVGESRCTDLAIGRPPAGMLAVCVPGSGAKLVPDPAALAPRCTENGFLVSEVPAKAGRPHGVMRVYDRAGRLVRELPYVDGVLEGEGREYLVGLPPVLVQYRAGKENGVRRAFHANGKPSAIIPMKAGCRHGTERALDDTGGVVRELVWEDGALISAKGPRGEAATVHAVGRDAKGRPTQGSVCFGSLCSAFDACR